MATWTNTSKNSATWTNSNKSAQLIYLLTDALDYILVGELEDLTLVIQEGTPWATLPKS